MHVLRPKQVEPPEAFYPIHWSDVQDFIGPRLDEQRQVWRTIKLSSYAVHLWNRKAADVSLDRRSLYHRLLHTWTVLPN